MRAFIGYLTRIHLNFKNSRKNRKQEPSKKESSFRSGTFKTPGMDRLYMIFSVLIFNFGVQCLLSSAEKDSNGIFPCRCKPEPELENGSKEACDRDTGNCTSGECLDGYHLRDIGHNVRICQPGTRQSKFEKVGIITLKQLQADTNLSSQGDTIDVRYIYVLLYLSIQ